LICLQLVVAHFTLPLEACRSLVAFLGPYLVAHLLGMDSHRVPKEFLEEHIRQDHFHLGVSKLKIQEFELLEAWIVYLSRHHF